MVSVRVIPTSVVSKVLYKSKNISTTKDVAVCWYHALSVFK